MTDAILVLNSGSSTIKYAIYKADRHLAKLTSGQVGRIGQAPFLEESIVGKAGIEVAQPRPFKLPLPRDADHALIVDWLLKHLTNAHAHLNFKAAGHRIVHGGQSYTKSVKVEEAVIHELAGLEKLAPNHQPHNLAGVKALQALWPGLLQVACFDTSFHRTQPRLAQLFPLNRQMADDGILRYGFHGLSYASIASRLHQHLSNLQSQRVLVLHLGHGCSLCALKERKSIATTMGFTSLGGLMMGKRCGDLDPGVLLYCLNEKKMDGPSLEDLLNNRSGLLGMSGISDDMRDLLESSEPAAKEAVDLFVYRIVESMGQLIAVLQGVDAIVFTAGIGENSPEIRARIIDKFHWLGLALDEDKNRQNEIMISSEVSRIPVLRMKTDEELMIAQETYKTLALSD